MTIADQTLTFTTSPDGVADGLVQTISPGAGEIYYIDYIQATTDGAGADVTSFATYAKIAPDAITPGNTTGDRGYIWFNNFTLGGRLGSEGDGYHTTVGMYLADGLELTFHEGADSGSSASTMNWAVHVRRVL